MRGRTKWTGPKLARYGIASLVLGLLGCGSSSDVVNGIHPSIGVVYGWLTRAQGGPLEQAQVEVFVTLEEVCGEELREPLGDFVGTAVTDSSGYYMKEINWAHIAEATHCIAVRVTPSGAGDEGARTFLAGELTLRHETLTPPVDSLRFDATVMD